MNPKPDRERLEDAEHAIVRQQEMLMEARNRMTAAWRIVGNAYVTAAGGRSLTLKQVKEISEVLTCKTF